MIDILTPLPLVGAAAGPISPGVVEKVLKRFDTPGAVNDINKVKDVSVD